MIAYLKGRLIRKAPDHIILDIGGVGYSASIPLSTYLKLGELHDEAELFIHTHSTDSAILLYGFHTEEEKSIFLKLISISGIGPKIALNILSGIEASDLKDAIRGSDIARLSLIPGIGKKTAMRIALELQEKLTGKEDMLKPEGMQEREDLISALTNMGFKRKEVESIIDDTIKAQTREAGFEQILREGLKRLAKL